MHRLTFFTRTATATLLHTKGDLASIGGPHVVLQHDVTESLAFRAGKIDQVTYGYDHLARIGQTGVPSSCITKASEAKFQEYLNATLAILS
jgi:hypothetical protein